jgi:hypothetical protein
VEKLKIRKFTGPSYTGRLDRGRSRTNIIARSQITKCKSTTPVSRDFLPSVLFFINQNEKRECLQAQTDLDKEK